MNKAGKSNLISLINGKDQFASCVSVVKYNLLIDDVIAFSFFYFNYIYKKQT